MMHRENWVSELLLESVLYLTLVLGSMGVLTMYAGNIPLEMSRIKVILLNKLSEQSNGDCLRFGEKQINYIIKRDVNVLTACNLFEMDRGFLLKVLITVVAQAVVIYQLRSSGQLLSSKRCQKMVDSWKTRSGLVTGYLLLGPRSFEKCGVHCVETVYSDRNSDPPSWPRSQKGNNAGSRLLFETSGQKDILRDSNTTVSQPV
ncbi:uncharacterized protein TNCV_4235361 [Trichonephila clavipes]|nr:uncharacterized protein TNCV_4235361 [Trichonephila clavipes]